MYPVDQHAILLLELPAIRERIAGLAAFEGGAALARSLEPSGDAREVVGLRAITREAVVLWDHGVSGPGGAHDVRGDVEDARRGARLEVSALERIRTTAEVAAEMRATLDEHSEAAPLIHDVADMLDAGAMERVARRLDDCLDGRGGIRDDASAGLARARRDVLELRRQAQDALREVAQAVRPHLQEGFITERAGRPVLAVKASSRSAVPGIVHDTSDSGGTLFVEPLPVVEASNRVREAVAREREELAAVLASLTAMVEENGYALEVAVDSLAEIDLRLARAALSRQWRGAPVEDGDPLLVGARHPLLEPGSAVPITLDLTSTRALVVSGPNTGGKTVSLKTLGLFALLHQCGLEPPADRVRLPVFDAVLADIGDEQSIAESLSTFSAHVRTLIGVLRDAGPRSLVLLDEVGAGTDPSEGAAIAQAVLGELLDRGSLVLATTHSPEVKSWAVETPGASNAAVGLDPDTLAPTYRLAIGDPGGSHAIGIAERLGMPASVLDRARAAMGAERTALMGLTEDAERARAAAERDRRAAAEARAIAERERTEAERQREKLRTKADQERARMREAAEAELADLRVDLTALRKEIAAGRRLEDRDRRSGDRQRDRDRRLGAADEAARRAAGRLSGLAAPAAPERAPEVGEHAVDVALGVRGVVISIEGDEAELQGPSARVRVPLARLTPDRTPAATAAPAPRAEARPVFAAISPEVDVRGQRAEAARRAVRDHIDMAAQAGLETVRVIHGRGTGALRAAVGDELSAHPLAKSWDLAPAGEGGDGATIVSL
jgi:DNA mismatch repair protein MutS2